VLAVDCISTITTTSPFKLGVVAVSAFQLQGSSLLSPRRHPTRSQVSTVLWSNTNKNNDNDSRSNIKNNWFQELWDEVIEFSTYGPAERKILKAQRQAAREQQQQQRQLEVNENDQQDETSMEDAFRRRVEKIGQHNMNDARKTTSMASSSVSSPTPPSSLSSPGDVTDSDFSLQAFQAAAAAAVARRKTTDNDDDDGPEFDGYQLRDLLVSKFGVPLDIDFQRGYIPSSLSSPTTKSSSSSSSQATCVYCTVLPFVGYGSRTKSRHLTELDYLMHLQAVVEILHKYNNLSEFWTFVETTTKLPKPGIESLPFRMILNEQQLNKILVGGEQ
jgi:Domain of unknown function (DUF3067)